MILKAVTLRPYSLPLRNPWRTAKGERRTRDGWLVIAETTDGKCGYGDCAPLPDAGTETREEAEAGASYLNRLRDVSFHDAETALNDMTPALRCGTETALLDCVSQEKGLPLSKVLDPDAARSVNVNAVMGTADADLPLRAEQACAGGFRILKIKVGVYGTKDELSSLRQTTTRLPEGVGLRLDANSAWTADQARSFLDDVDGLPIESIEDPLHDPTAEGLARIQERTPFVVAADESIHRVGLSRLIEAGAVKRVVLKPMVLGGLWPAILIARKARNSGLSVVATTTLDSAAGVWAAAHLAAAADPDGIDHHGLATGEWLSSDTGSGPKIKDGRIIIGDHPGLAFIPINS